MDMKEYQEQETFTDLKKYLEAQQDNLNNILTQIGIYTCRDDDNEYYGETFSIPCFSAEHFIIFAYINNTQNKNIQDSIQKVLKILNQKGEN